MENIKNILTKTLTTHKDFSYEKKGVTLKFNLPIDDSSSLRPFRECLEQAIKDIDELLEGMKN